MLATWASSVVALVARAVSALALVVSSVVNLAAVAATPVVPLLTVDSSVVARVARALSALARAVSSVEMRDCSPDPDVLAIWASRVVKLVACAALLLACDDLNDEFVASFALTVVVKLSNSTLALGSATQAPAIFV